MIKYSSVLLALMVAASAATNALAETIDREICLGYSSDLFVERAGVVVTQADVDAFLRERVPENERAQVLQSADRVGQILNNLLVTFAMARNVLEADILQDEAFQGRLYYRLANDLRSFFQEQYLDQAELDDYETLAREIFLSQPELFQTSQRLDFYHLLVADTGEFPEVDLMKRVLEAYERIESGEDFVEVAVALSDEPATSENGAMVKGAKPEEIAPQVLAILSETPKGKLAAPVRSRFGWHLVRLADVHPAETQAWEDARETAKRIARERHRASVMERFLRGLNQTPVEFAPGAVADLYERYGVRREDGPSEVSVTSHMSDD